MRNQRLISARQSSSAPCVRRRARRVGFTKKKVLASGILQAIVGGLTVSSVILLEWACIRTCLKSTPKWRMPIKWSVGIQVLRGRCMTVLVLFFNPISLLGGPPEHLSPHCWRDPPDCLPKGTKGKVENVEVSWLHDADTSGVVVDADHASTEERSCLPKWYTWFCVYWNLCWHIGVSAIVVSRVKT